jgi:ring-1,2-phenylacetyl-CoA epoxidase subunit PaaE
MSESPPRARPSTLDLLAATVARVTPAAVHPALEALRRVRGARGEDLVPLDQVRVLATILPRPVAERVDALRRDVRTVTRSLRGEPPVVVTPLRPAPTDERAPRASGAAPVAKSIEPRALRVLSVIDETADARSFVLEDPRGATLAWVAGQFVTVLVTIDGVTHRRAYSISSGIDELPRVRITVKRVANGLVSNHLNDHVRAGDTLTVLGPSGAFTLEEAAASLPDRALPERLWMFAGGSGITPVYALARAALAANPWTRVTLVYANRSEQSVIFRDALDALAREYSHRLEVLSVLEHTPTDVRHVGRLDRAMADRVCDDLALPADALCFLCGPEPMMDAVRAALLARGVDRARVREERFSAPQRRAETDAPSQGGHALTILYRGRSVQVRTAPGQTVLEAGLAAGVDMPFSCTMGGCGACKVSLASGSVEMEEPNCLTERERSAGAVLACVGRASADAIVEVPDDGR